MPGRDLSPPVPAGWDVARFRIEEVLGAGGFATVYRAQDDRLDDTVAIKLLADNHALDPALRERFLGEGRALRRIDSPHVVRVHDVGETGNHRPYLVLEFADRGSLRHRVEQRRAQGWWPGAADVWSVARPLASGVAAVHQADLVHRDVNPANVLLTTRGLIDPGAPSALVGADERLMLADLGLCKDLAINTGYTVAGGTEGFRPPELRVGPTVVDRTADLWSLTAVVFWLVAAHPPPAEADEDVVRSAIVAAELPEALAGVLSVGLADDPGRRHPDVSVWLDALDAALRPARPRPLATFEKRQPPGDVEREPVGTLADPVAPGAAAPWLTAPAFVPPPLPEPAPRVGTGLTGSPTVRQQFRHAAWMLWGLLSAGFLAGVGFLYIGFRSGRRTWQIVGAVCCAVAVASGALFELAPNDADGEIESSWQANVGTALVLGLYLVTIAYGLVANLAWTRWRLGQRPR